MGQITGWLLKRRMKGEKIYFANGVDELFWIKSNVILLATGIIIAK